MIKPLEEVLNFQSSAVINRFVKTHPSVRKEANLIFDDVKRFLWLCAKLQKQKEDNTIVDIPDISFSESMYIIDEMWHEFILLTEYYSEFCKNYLGRYIHHPTPMNKYQRNLKKFGEKQSMKVFLEEMITCVYDNLGQDVAIRWFNYYHKYSTNTVNGILSDHKGNGSMTSFSFKETVLKEKRRLDFKNSTLIPRYTEKGFIKMPVPKKVYEAIINHYHEKRQEEDNEYQKGSELDRVLKSTIHQIATGKIPITDELKSLMIDGLQPILEEWSNQELLATIIYGIRIYRRGASLIMHTDTPQTNVLGIIINVDQKVEKPWGLQIQNHEQVEHEFYLEPGEMLLYESATLKHGRVKSLEGDYYANIFAHFIPLN